MSSPTIRDRWTSDEFKEMSWHDNHFYGFSIVEGEYGAGTVSFDLDYILEWLKLDSGAIGFRIAPATLTFYDVTHLTLHIDYATPTAGLGPFSTDSIERIEETRERYVAVVWRLNLNWPEGYICFEASGFEQRLRGEPIVSSRQALTAVERGDA